MMCIMSLSMVAKAQIGDYGRSVRIGYGYLGGTVEPLMATSTTGSNASIYSGASVFVDADLFSLSTDVSLGTHLGIWKTSMAMPDETIGTVPTFRFGIDMHYHVLENDRWSIMLNGSVGSYFHYRLTPQAEYGVGATVTFYPTEHWGVYAECDWGKYWFDNGWFPVMGHSNTLLKAGVSYRFR